MYRKTLLKGIKTEDNDTPEEVVDQLVSEFLRKIGDRDWNDPENALATLADIMTLDLNKPIEEQIPTPTNIDRTVLVPAKNMSRIPFWVCQGLIRVDGENRWIEHDGKKYDKIEIARTNTYFKARMNIVASTISSVWNIRWGSAEGGAATKEQKLYKKLQPGETEPWLTKCIRTSGLLKENETDIPVEGLMMIEFKRDMDPLYAVKKRM